MSQLPRAVPSAPETTDQVEYKIASTLEERAGAFSLVYKSYLEAGLGRPNPCRMRVTPYHLLLTTEVFIATFRDEVVFTMSLVIDGELGLPMECVYADEVARRRRQGLRIAELSCLADRRSQFRGFFPVFLRLSRLTAQYARRRKLDQLLAAVHPRHARFYRRQMAFESIGTTRAYPTVRNHPAVALCFDLARLEREKPPAYELLYRHPLSPELLDPQPITPDEVEYFGAMVDPSFQLAPLGPAEGFAADALSPVLVS